MQSLFGGIEESENFPIRNMLHCRTLTLHSFFALYDFHTAASISFSNCSSKENSAPREVNIATDVGSCNRIFYEDTLL